MLAATYHTSVLTEETIEYLNLAKGKKFIDATLGGGGHTRELLKRGAKVLALDRDKEAIEYAKENSEESQDLVLVEGNFSNIKGIAEKEGFDRVDGILFDLGVSSHQLDKAERGFSFQQDGPLDMRMDTSITVAASDIVNNFDKRRLYEIFQTYGQEKYSWPISNAIFSARQIKPIETTGELAKIIEGVYRGKRAKGKLINHPATKVFQALRIVVNSELLNLEESLPQTVGLLKPGGRLVVISFHSLEDRIVKRFFKQEPDELKVLTAKPIGPNTEEVVSNPRSRSAKLRAAEKI